MASSGPVRTRRRAAVIVSIVVVAVVVVVTVAVIGFTANRTSERATTEPLPSALPSHASVVFLGDSFTQGAITTTPAARWTSRVARHFGWAETNLGAGGTGYQAGSATGGPYDTRIAAAAAAHPDLVIVSGGLNDLGAMTQSPAAEATAVGRTFRELRRALPHAVVVALRPFWNASATPPLLATLARDVRAAATASGGHYADIGQPLAGQPQRIAGDGIHPNDDGHALLAGAIERQLDRVRVPA